jgi:hypothetical protein
MQDESGNGDQPDRVPQNPLGDEDAWNDAFRPGLNDNPEVAQDVARLLSIIKDSAESDPGGTEAVAGLLDSAIHLMFPYTDTYRIARELWMLSLRGVLEWKNEPDQLLKPAIEQGNKELQRLRPLKKTASQKQHLS